MNNYIVGKIQIEKEANVFCFHPYHHAQSHDFKSVLPPVGSSSQ